MKKIGILGAMEVEVELFKEKYEVIKEHKIGKVLVYESVEPSTKNKIFFTHSQIGKVFSAMVTTILINEFKVDMVIFTGIAGSLNPKLHIKDVVIGSKLCQHDVDITAFGHPKGYITNSEVYQYSDKDLINKFEECVKEEGIDVKRGTIATGDQFINSQIKKEEIKKDFSADMIEMEGASVAVVCSSLNVPFLVTRTISDNANDDGIEDFNKFMIESANINAKIVSTFIKKI